MTDPKLHIGKGLNLRLDAVTKTFAILAQRRKGKTYTASVIAEEMVKAGQPWVALDPTGAWWGLRAGADGGPEGGLPVYVFGGQHGDIPLERTAGAEIADVVVDNPRWYVLDLSSFESKAAERQFATDFAERFYRRKGKSPEPIHLFVDEADVFVPQRSPAGDARMLGAFEAIVRRGGIRGIGTTLISQRAAVVNKNVLEQVDVLVVLRIVGPNDQKAIRTYVEAYGSDADRDALMGSLASLKLGEAWFWEPGSSPALFERVQVRERHTFNSSATPKAGAPKAGQVAMADVDLKALTERIASSIEEAKANDPKQLRQEIKRLERELAQRPAETVEVEKLVEVPALAAGDLQLLHATVSELGNITDSLSDGLARIQAPSPRRNQGTGTAGGSPRERAKGGARREATRRAPAPSPTAETNGDLKLKKAERSALTVLAQYPDEGRTTTQVALLAGYSAKGGGFRNALGRLRSLGLITPAGTEPIRITDEGLAVAGDVPSLPSGEELLDHWLGQLKKAEREILGVLYVENGAALTPEEIADRTETQYEPTGGGFRNALGKLRTLELIEGRGEIRISEVFDG